MPEYPADRYHNREQDSPESLHRSIDALAEAVASLDRKLGDVTLRLDGEVEVARGTTRRLAADVALMGEALARRIEAGIPSPPPRRSIRGRGWLLAAALIGSSLVALGGVWLFR